MEPTNDPTLLPNLSDEDLAKLFQQGFKKAGDQLFDRHRAKLTDYARRAYGEGGDKGAEDLLHEAYLVALAKFDTFKPENFVGWIKSIVTNIAKNWRRQDLGTKFVEEDISTFEDWSPSLDRDKKIAAEDEYAITELLAALDSTLRGVEEHSQEIGRFMLAQFRDRGELPTVRQIEQATGTSHGTAQRAREEVIQVWKATCQKRGFWPIG